ncbi:MAG: DNA-directed RNA polymerase subunit omega [Clostridia bacterium]|nr:DNA-directed RNA polymerase subunit omega [Clostridia bacterium]
MIVKPTTAELLEKTGENKFCLVIATAKRARQISNGSERLVNSDERSTVTVAAEELAEGRVKIC